MKTPVNGILLLYHHPFDESAATITEHVRSFERHSSFGVWSLNTAFGFPAALKSFRFRIVVLHYSLFSTSGYRLDNRFLSYLEQDGIYKVAFLQDEHHYCRARFAFLNNYGIDCVWTLIEPAYWPQVYRRYTNVPKLVYTIPGYVSEELVAAAAAVAKPDDTRA